MTETKPVGAKKPKDAAEYLGISVNTFYAQVMPKLRVVRLGTRWLIPVAELDRWLREEGERREV